MAEFWITLQITKREQLPEYTDIYQTDDGTIYYFMGKKPEEKLYVKWQDRNIDAQLPGPIDSMEAYGNAVYFSCSRKVYKAVYIPYVEPFIVVSLVRDQLEDEHVFKIGICCRVTNGRKLFHRLCDDPHAEGISVQTEEIASVMGIHRRKLVLSIYWSPIIRDLQSIPYISTLALMFYDPPPVKTISNDHITVEASNIFVKESSRFVFVSLESVKSEYTRIIDTRTSRYVGGFRIETMDQPLYVAGFHNGEVTMKMRYGGTAYLVNAKLPQEYLSVDSEEEPAMPTQDANETAHLEENETPQQEAKKSKKKKKKNKQAAGSSREAPTCVICLDKTPNIVFFDCMHVCVCEECFKKAPAGTYSFCPNCRQQVKQSSKVFL